MLLAAPARAAVPPPRQIALARNASAFSAAPAGRAAYFVTDITGGGELWTASPAGGWPAQLTETGGKVSQAVLSPDGRSFAYVSAGDLFLAPTGGEPRNLTDSPRPESDPAFSPDGRRLAYLGEGAARGVAQLMLRELDSGTVRALTKGGEPVRAAAWAPDGRRLAAVRGASVLLLRADGKQERAHDAAKAGKILSVQWSPDGDRLLLLAEEKGGRRRLLLMHPRKGTLAPAGPEHWDVRKVAWRPDSGLWLLRRHAGASSLYRLRSPRSEPERVSPFVEDVQDFAVDEEGGAALLLYRAGAKSLAISRVTLNDARRAEWRRERVATLRAPKSARK